ncbi:MAG: DUF4123 domain-containing protein, partial [Pseudomonadales bacterium]|nr:DUF4123 domain-containing protein [Pseudomonadales bacterium]
DDTLTRTASRISNELHLQLADRPTGKLLLLLDPVLRSIAEGDALAEGLGALTSTPVKFVRYGIDPSHRPYLLELDTLTLAGSDYLARSVYEALTELQPAALRTGAGRRIGGWLASKAPPAQVAHHLASVMITHREDGSAFWLRLHDPAVLWWLWNLLEPAQRRILLGPIETLWLLDPAGQLVVLRGAPGQEPVQPALFLPLGLSAQQWQDIENIESLNVALRQWGGATAHPEQLDSLCTAVRNTLRRARACGFSDRRDLAAYALCALRVHPAFDTHPHMRERIEARGEDDYFTSLIEEFEDEDWQRIARECEAGIIASLPPRHTVA